MWTPGLGATSGDDTYVGDEAVDIVDGLAGDDILSGAGGNDVLTGGDGVDALDGGEGDDILRLTASDGDFASAGEIYAGGAGTDTLLVFESSSIAEAEITSIEKLVFAADGGITELYLSSDQFGAGISATAELTGSQGDTRINIEMPTSGVFSLAGFTFVNWGVGDAIVVDGFSGADTITGSSQTDVLFGAAGDDTLSGGAGNDTLVGDAGADTLDGGAGDDRYFIDAGDVYWESAGAGIDTVLSAVNNHTLGDNVENLVLENVANGSGNALDNTITGNGLANILDGKEGADTMIGDAGNDTYVVDNTGDTVTEDTDAGVDQVNTYVSYTLGANLENLNLSGSANLYGVGNALNNTLSGNSGDNILEGKEGADTMSGGDGADTASYASSSTGVTINLATSAISGGDADGDTFNSIENITGSSFADTLTGDGLANILNGGAGADTLRGGAGDDVYIVDHSGDRVTEGTPSGGVDRVESSISFTLGANFENLTLLGTAAINAVGNTLNNSLTGNSGANTLDGKEGADTMSGGAGNDIYGVNSSGDVVSETADGGVDQINAYVTTTLGANIEKLSLRGTAKLNGAGNELDNALGGNGNDNVLDGKAGADTMSGAGGDDTYGVDNAGDVVKESAGGGYDRINSYVSLTLAANVEMLQLRGSANLNGAGNGLDNTILGNSGANILKGGLGLDFLTGGAGDDLFKFDTALSAGNVDAITDFNVANDGLQLENNVFTALTTTGVLNADAFHTGASAHDATDRVIYDATTGALYYDADGTGAGAAIQFAQLSAGLGLTNADIFVV